MEPLPAIPASSLDDGAVPALAVELPRFCRRCGVAWQTGWLVCSDCAAREVRAAVPLDVREEHRAIKSAVGLYFSLLAVCLVGMICGSADNALKIDVGVSIGLTAVALVWCAASWRLVLPALGRLGHPGWLGAALGLSLVTFGIATGVIALFQHVTHLPSFDMSEPFLDGGYGWGMVVLFIAVQPAVVEELAFRGVILGALQKALSPFESVIVSAMMFMILHLSVARFPHTLALGIGAGYLRLRSRSLYPCILMHFSHNFLCVASEWSEQ